MKKKQRTPSKDIDLDQLPPAEMARHLNDILGTLKDLAHDVDEFQRKHFCPSCVEKVSVCIADSTQRDGVTLCKLCGIRHRLIVMLCASTYRHPQESEEFMAASEEYARLMTIRRIEAERLGPQVH